MNPYTTNEEIERDLKRLKLEKDIAWEELKLMKNEYKEDLKPLNWVTSFAKLAGKYGVFALMKRLISK